MNRYGGLYAISRDKDGLKTHINEGKSKRDVNKTILLGAFLFNFKRFITIIMWNLRK